MREVDSDAIIRAIEAGDAEALARVTRLVGLGLSLDDARRLHLLVRPPLTWRAVLLAMHEAMLGATGIVAQVVRRPRGDLAARDAALLAVRHEAHVTVGIRLLSSDSDGFVDAWPELSPWYQQLSRNRQRARAWALREDRERIRVPIAPPSALPPDVDTAALFAAIVDDPCDLAARSVLADRLLERDDPRGELIRIDLTLRELPHDAPERADLVERERRLVRIHGPQLAADVAPHVADFEIAGGFVDQVTMAAPAFRKHGEALFRAQPIRALSIKPWNDDAVKMLARSLHLSRVRALKVGNAGHGRLVTLRPLAAGRFDRLETLHVHSTFIEGEDGERLMRELVAPRLQALRVSDGGLGAQLLRGLAANEPLCARLEKLELSWLRDRFTPTGSPTLDLDPRTAADEAFEQLALPALRCLELHMCWFATDARNARLVARAPRLERFNGNAERATLEVLVTLPSIHTLVVRSRTVPQLLDAMLALPALARLTVLPEDWTEAQLEDVANRLLALPASHPLQAVVLPGPFMTQLQARFPARTHVV